MSLLYKDSKDVTVKVLTTFKEGNLILEFEADCGKFGTDESLDSYTLTPAQLLDILQENKKKYEDNWDAIFGKKETETKDQQQGGVK